MYSLEGTTSGDATISYSDGKINVSGNASGENITVGRISEEGSEEISFKTSKENVNVKMAEHNCSHDSMVHHKATAPNCTTEGNSEYWYCPDCKKYYSDADGEDEDVINEGSWVIKAKGHNYVNHTTPAGYMSNGRSYDECTNCHGIINDTTLPGYSTSYVKSFKLAKGKKCFTAKWKKQNKKTQKLFSGYQVRWSTDPGMGGAGYKNVGKGKASVKIKGGAKTRYYVQVRTYTGGYYSPWSAMKSVVTK